MKTCFSAGKLMKQFGNLPLSKRALLSTNPPICQNFKNQKPPPPNFRREGGGNYEVS